MGTQVSLDGKLLRADEARISVFDRGFLYGDSIYEVFRTYRGVPFETEAHLDRLEGSAARIGFRVPVERSVLKQRLDRTLRAAGNGESYIRLVVTRGEGAIGLDPALAVNPHVLFIVRPLEPPPESFYRDGVQVSLVHPRLDLPHAPDPAAKTGNRLVSILGLQEARALGSYEAILLDGQDRVTEGSTSNIFAWVGDRLVTPPQGILEGVTRRIVLRVAGELGLQAAEEELTGDGLRAAQEVFLTSTLRELIPVVQVDGRPIGTGRPGSRTLRLLAAFRARALRAVASP
jgi:branched-chain amino acid aminotransferase